MKIKILRYKFVTILLLVILLIPVDAFAAFTWTERRPFASWNSAASDADGSNLIVGGATGRLYTSSDGGANWTERQPAGNVNQSWYGIASDDDGSNLLAVAYNGRVYTSSDSGANWTERQPLGNVNSDWFAAASDADGSNLIIGNETRLYTSSDGGANWTERQPSGNVDKAWYGVSSDADGSNLVVAAYNHRLYTSSDGGANWTERQPAGNLNRNWYDVASDDDGSNLIATSYSRLYTSSDGGVNWTERQPAGNVDRSWETVSSDADGSVLFVASRGFAGRMYVSYDSGVNWTEEQPAGDVVEDWAATAIDADGSNLLVGANGGSVYTGVAADAVAPTVSTLSPVDNATGVSTTANLVITFDEAVDPEAGADNNIVIKKAGDDSVIETIDAQDGTVTGGGTTVVTINPTVTLAEQTAYYVQIGADAFDDTAGNSYAGISDTTSWSFTTGDFTNPSVVTYAPVDGAGGVDTGSDLVITFNEIVDVETGNITIRKVSDGSIVESIAVGATTGTGTTAITINPVIGLDYSTEYYVNIDATDFDDVNSNSYAGISDATTWNFVTEGGPVSGSSPRRRVTTNNSINNNANNVPAVTYKLGLNLLKINSKGEEVKELQRFLNFKLGLNLDIDGIFGQKTKAGVVDFQKLNNLEADGIVGPLTRAKIQAE